MEIHKDHTYQATSTILKLPGECGPVISDHTKQHCRNKR